MGGKAPAGNDRTLIDLPTPIKAELHGVAAIAKTTFRLEVIAALRHWLDQPDPGIRAEVAARYDGRPNHGRRRPREEPRP